MNTQVAGKLEDVRYKNERITRKRLDTLVYITQTFGWALRVFFFETTVT